MMNQTDTKSENELYIQAAFIAVCILIGQKLYFWFSGQMKELFGFADIVFLAVAFIGIIAFAKIFKRKKV